MRFRWLIVFGLIISIFGFSLTQTEISVLRYQLQMPSIVGNAVGFRVIGTFDDGAFGVVWKIDKKLVMFTGQVLGMNSVISEFIDTGVFEWSKVYFDIFLLLRF